MKIKIKIKNKKNEIYSPASKHLRMSGIKLKTIEFNYI